MSDTLEVDRGARWTEIQALSRKVASKDGAPTEIESALCGAVVRARDALEENEHLREVIETLRDELSSAFRRGQEAEQDAKRYRHMRGSAQYEYRNGPGLYWYLPRWNRDLPPAERLDAAIDQAILDSVEGKK